MSHYSKTISFKLNPKEYSTLVSNAANLHMSTSQYIRSLITGDSQNKGNYDPEIASAICKIYLLLEEQGLEKESISQEVYKLCQLLK